MAKRVYYYYLSEDPCNPKEITEIESLSKVMRLTVITTNRTIPTIDGVKFRIIKRPRKNITNILRIWAKICFLICNNSESLTDVNVDRRNIYSLNKFSRNISLHIRKIHSPEVNRSPNYTLTFNSYQTIESLIVHASQFSQGLVFKNKHVKFKLKS